MTPDCFEENQKSFVDGECCMAVCSVEGFLMTDMPLFDFVSQFQSFSCQRGPFPVHILQYSASRAKGRRFEVREAF